MAYSYDDKNTRKGNGCNNLVIYSFNSNGPTEVSIPKGFDFENMYRTARAIFSRSFASYAGSMYKQESSIQMEVLDQHGNRNTVPIVIDLTNIEHVVGLPHDRLIATRVGGVDVPVTTEKGFIDYLNYFIYSSMQSTPRTYSISDLNDKDRNEADKYLKILEAFDETIKRDISSNLTGSTYEEQVKMLNVLYNAQDNLLDLSNKPLTKTVKELYSYSLYILKNINDLVTNITQLISDRKFNVTIVDGIITVEIRDDFEKEFYADVLHILTNSLIGSNINNKQQASLIAHSLSSPSALLELLRNFKTAIASSLTSPEFDVLIESQFSNIKNFVIGEMIKKYDSTALSIEKYNNEEKKDASNRISNYIKGNSSSRTGKGLVSQFNNIAITDSAILDLERNMNNGNEVAVWDALPFLLTDYSNSEFYLSVLSFMSKYSDKAIDFLNDHGEYIDYFDAIYNYLDKGSDIAYKYVTILNELSSINGDKPISDSKLKGLFSGENPVLLEKLGYSQLTNRYLTSRDKVNAKINEFRKIIFFDDLNATTIADDEYLVYNLSLRAEQLIAKYGIAYIFNIMLHDQKMRNLFEFEHAALEINDPNSKMGLKTPDLILPRGSNESDFEYLKRVWNKVSRITCFEYQYHSDGSPMTYGEIIDMFKRANSCPISEYDLFDFVKRINQLVSVSINDPVDYADAIEQFKCLKMSMYQRGVSSDKEIYAPYLRTILWDKIMYKAEMLTRIDESVFSSSLLRKAVDYVIHDISEDSTGLHKQATFNSNIVDVGLVLEIPTKVDRSILLYLRDEGRSFFFEPAHILSDVLVGTDTYDVYLVGGAKRTIDITKNDGSSIERPIVGYSSDSLTDTSGRIDFRKLIRNNVISRQMDTTYSSDLDGADLIVSQGGAIIQYTITRDRELTDLKNLLRTYGIVVAADRLSSGGVSR